MTGIEIPAYRVKPGTGPDRNDEQIVVIPGLSGNLLFTENVL